jgi:hypothetical protein
MAEKPTESADERDDSNQDAAEDSGGSPAAGTPGEREDRERGGPTAGDRDVDVQDSDDDAATPDGST